MTEAASGVPRVVVLARAWSPAAAAPGELAAVRAALRGIGGELSRSSATTARGW